MAYLKGFSLKSVTPSGHSRKVMPQMDRPK